MPAILPVHPLQVDHPQIGLVHQGRRLQRVPGALAPHPAAGQTPQLLLNKRHQRRQCALVAVPPRVKKIGDVVQSA